MFDEFDLNNYAVSNYGKVMNISRKEMLTPYIKNQYAYVLPCNKGKTKNYRINRLVAFAFVSGRTAEKNIVNHLNENKLDNRSVNLEWTTSRGNTIHSVGKKVQQIDPNTNEVLKTFDTVIDAFKYLGKPHSGIIAKCCNGTIKNIYGFKWKYV